MKCVVCTQELLGTWTDYHGELECNICGTPYQVIHYDSDRKRIDKPPTCILQSDLIKICQEYFNETGHHMALGTYLGRHPRQKDNTTFYKWLAIRYPEML